MPAGTAAAAAARTIGTGIPSRPVVIVDQNGNIGIPYIITGTTNQQITNTALPAISNEETHRLARGVLAMRNIRWHRRVTWLLLCSTLVSAASEEAAEKISLGKKLLEQGKVEAAISEFQKATTIDPKYGAAQLNLGYAYERASLSDEAMDAYRKSIELEAAQLLRAQQPRRVFILRRECMIKPSPSSRMP